MGAHCEVHQTEFVIFVQYILLIFSNCTDQFVLDVRLKLDAPLPSRGLGLHTGT